MKRDSRIGVLKDIGQICDAQRQRAELDVERMNTRLDHLRRQREREDRDLKTQEEAWAAVVRGGSLQLMASAAWATEVLRTQAEIAGTEKAIGEGRTMRQGLCATLHALSARADSVEEMTVLALRRDLRRRDEAVMNAQIHRTLPGWSATCE